MKIEGAPTEGQVKTFVRNPKEFNEELGIYMMRYISDEDIKVKFDIGSTRQPKWSKQFPMKQKVVEYDICFNKMLLDRVKSHFRAVFKQGVNELRKHLISNEYDFIKAFVAMKNTKEGEEFMKFSIPLRDREKGFYETILFKKLFKFLDDLEIYNETRFINHNVLMVDMKKTLAKELEEGRITREEYEKLVDRK